MTVAPQEYVLAASVRARLLGAGLAAAGLLVCVLVAVLAAFARGAVPVAVIAVLLVLVAFGVLLRRRTVVVRLDEVGYRVRFVRGVGTSTARWDDVAGLDTADVAGARCAVLRLRDGRSTTIPVELLAGDPESFVRDLGARLETASNRRQRSASRPARDPAQLAPFEAHDPGQRDACADDR